MVSLGGVGHRELSEGFFGLTGPNRVLVMSGISINREVTSLFITHSLTLSCSA